MADDLAIDERAVQSAVDEVLADVPGAGSELAAPSSDVRDLAMQEVRDALPTWAERYVRVFDDWLRVPGMDRGIGLDAVIGFIIPGAGDAITGVGSMGLLSLALKQRVPTVIIGKMLINIGVDVLLGLFPMVGDAFDLIFRSNRRNLELIQKHKHGKEKPSLGDRLLVAFGFLLATTSIILPFVIAYSFGAALLAALIAFFSGG